MSPPAGSALIALLGETTLEELTTIRVPADLPPGLRVLVLEGERAVDGLLLRNLRERYPRATFVALLNDADPVTVDRALTAGADVIAFGVRHLRHVVAVERLEITRRNTQSLESETHSALVNLIDEFNTRPQLAEVLRTAVLRMSTLFGIDRVTVVLLKAGDDVAFVVAEHEQSLVDNIVIRLRDYPELQAICKSHEPLVIPDVLGDSLLLGVRTKIEHAERPPRAAVLFPLLHRGAVVGAMFLRGKVPVAAIDSRLMRTGRLIASLTSVAVGSALEHDTLRSEQRRLLRKKAETDEKLAGLQQFSEFFSKAHDGIVVTDEAAMIRYTNAAASQILGRDPQDLRSASFIDLLAPTSHRLARRVLAGDNVGDGYIDLVVETKSSGTRVISAAIRPLDEPAGHIVSFRDVTELREIETELRQTKDFLENLIQSSVDAIVAADVDGRIILFNRAAEQILGFSAQEVVGTANISSFFLPGETADVMRRLRSEAFGGPGRLETTRKDVVAKTGEIVPVSLTASIIYEAGHEVAIVGVFTDLRERLKMEEKLSQVQRKLQSTERQAVAMELAGAAAHELNQPLTSILGYAEILRRRLPADDANRKPVDTICRETERMAAIVKKIGQITAYQTKPYVGSSQILDLGVANGEPPKDKPGG
ncbi:MAG: PAS domain S-box protein [Deltaproteobacteria bacterium]|nr:PAS domain S-box protein [Deltaproteobacteria bacterium]